MNATSIATTRLVRGITVPALMYGTAWKAERTAALTAAAIGCGFRAIDTANQRKHYLEEGAGDGIKAAIGDGVVTREQVFVQTKFTPQSSQDQRLPYDRNAGAATQVRQSIASSLAHLGVSRLDSYILHGPSRRHGLTGTDWEIWRAMEAAIAAGEISLIGVSNVSREQLAALTEGAKIAPAFVQNRCFAHAGWDAGVRAFCADHGIVYQGFSLLTANPSVVTSRKVAEIAGRHGRTAAQIVFRFALQAGMMPLTGTASMEHMRQDLEVFDFSLSGEEHGVVLHAGMR